MSEEVVNEEVVEETTETPVESEATPAFVESMLEQISDEDVKSAGFWKNLEGKDANEVGQYIKELNSFAGKKGDIPKADATDEEWDEFYSKLGRPESIEGYDFVLNEDFKEIVGDGIDFYNSALDGFKEQVFKLGASPTQAEQMVDWYLTQVANQVEESNQLMTQRDEENEAELRKAWGESYDGMKRGIDAMLTSNGLSDEQLTWLKDSGILDEPTLVVTLGKIASKFADDPEIGHIQTKTQAGIRDQIEETNEQIAEYLRSGQKAPPRLKQKLYDLRTSLGDDL